jgi:hypothetical protein
MMAKTASEMKIIKADLYPSMNAKAECGAEPYLRVLRG